MSKEGDDDYPVGYKKPPAASQFKRGQSGNPKGRPKKSLNVSSTIRKALRERITVQKNGKPRHMTKFEAAIIQFVNRAEKASLVR